MQNHQQPDREQFRWIHFTDLHWGAKEQQGCWPSVKNALREDLAKLRVTLGGGPWDAVFFTGDLTNRGTEKEFDALNQCLNELWELFADQDSKPCLFPVPGNHDVCRNPHPSAAHKGLCKDGLDDPDIQDGIFEGDDYKNNEYFAVIHQAFAHYQNWRAQCPYLPQADMTAGRIPGDFSYSIKIGARTIGVVGINTAFLHLEGGDKKGKLDVHPGQWLALCDGDPPQWYQDRDLCIVLSHYPRDWLNAAGQSVFNEMSPGQWFAFHLCGHMHENRATEERVSGAARTRTTIQSQSLFSREPYEAWRNGEAEKKYDRKHGYSVGLISFERENAWLRHWPRAAVKKQDGNWRFERDASYYLEKDEGTQASSMPLDRQPPSGGYATGEAGNNDDSTRTTPSEGKTPTPLVERIRQVIGELLERPGGQLLVRTLPTQRTSITPYSDIVAVLTGDDTLAAICLLHQATEEYLKAANPDDDKVILWETAVNMVCWLLLLTIDDEQALKLSRDFSEGSPTLQIQVPVETECAVEIFSSWVDGVPVRAKYNTASKRVEYGGGLKPSLEEGFTKEDTLYGITKLIWATVYPERNIPGAFTEKHYARLNAKLKHRRRVRKGHYIAIPSFNKEHLITREVHTQLRNKQHLPDLTIFYFGIAGEESLLLLGGDSEEDLQIHVEDFLKLKTLLLPPKEPSVTRQENTNPLTL